MAVGTDDFALFHLVENVLPSSFREVPRYLKSLLALLVDVIELEHHRVALSAVDTRMPREVLEEKEGSLNAAQFFLRAGLLDVAGLVGEVVLAVICSVARTAHVVPLTLLFTSPREVLDGLPLPAPATAT